MVEALGGGLAVEAVVGMATLVEIRVEMEAEEVMVKQMRSNGALVSDVCAAALRASSNAPQRGRYAS